ncbi:15180_t:CDS:2, partial [Funneliformis caledonium]
IPYTLTSTVTFGLSETAIKILKKEELNGRDFFNMTKEKYMQDGLVRGSAIRLMKFAKEYKNKKLKAFSIYCSLKEILIQDFNKHLGHCVENILFRMKHYRSLVIDSLEFICNDYVLAILYIAFHIAEDETTLMKQTGGKNENVKFLSDMKNVLSIVVRMLVDKASAENESFSKKKAKVKEYRSKK